MTQKPLTSAATLVCLLPLLCGVSVAGDRPDVTGTWTLDAAQSDFGQLPVPEGIVVTVTGTHPDYQLRQSGGGQPDFEMRLDLSGREVTNDVPGGKMTSTHRWEGDVIVGDATLVTSDGARITFKDRISYSPDGRLMTQERTMSGPMGVMQMKTVMRKK